MWTVVAHTSSLVAAASATRLTYALVVEDRLSLLSIVGLVCGLTVMVASRLAGARARITRKPPE